MLATLPPVEGTASTFLAETEVFATSVAIDVRQLVKMIVDDGEEPILPRMEVVHAGARQPGLLEPAEGGGGVSSHKNPSQPAITGAAIFKGGKLLDFLDDKDTRGILWMRNELKSAVVVTTLEKPGKWITFDVVRSKTELKPRFEGDRIIMDVRIVALDPMFSDGAGVDARDPKVIEQLRAEVAEVITVRIRHAAEKVQKEFRSDVLGFGSVIDRADPAR